MRRIERKSKFRPESPNVEQATTTVLPFISVVMVVRNEGPFIARALEQVLAQDYPRDRMEIIVADGMSDDDTRNIVAEYQARYPFIQVVDNPGRIVASGMNVAIDRAQGELIVRIDGHGEVATDFCPPGRAIDGRASRGLERRRARSCTPARIVSAKPWPWPCRIPLGVGLATHRFADYEGYVEGRPLSHVSQVDLRSHRQVRRGPGAHRGRRVQLSHRAGRRQGLRLAPRALRLLRARPARQAVSPVLSVQLLADSRDSQAQEAHHAAPGRAARCSSLTMLVLAGSWASGCGSRWSPWRCRRSIWRRWWRSRVSVIPRKGLAVACLVPLALATMHFAYALGIAYGALAALFHPRAWDQSGTMSKLNR